MNLKRIQELWDYQERDLSASIEMWDSMAPEFRAFDIPTRADSIMLRIIDDEKMLNSESRVLDVGCGAGKYSFALSDQCHSITGLDLSPKMIEYANEKKQEMQKSNLAFFENDWHQSDLKQMDYEKKFDLVFAHMTPAIRNARTFQNLIDAGRGYGIMVKPTRRVDPVSDAIREMLGIAEKKESAEMDIAYAFEMLWFQGRFPRLEYEHQIWEMKKPVETAYKMYGNRMKSYRKLSLAEEDKIMAYLKDIAVDGMVEEAVDTTITAIYWQA